MFRHSWLPRLRSRLQPVTRQQRRQTRKAKRRYTLEQLELRALLTSVTDTATVSAVNQSQFGSGQALVSSGDYFLGAKNFDTGRQTIGGFVHPLGVKTGLQASVDLNGTAGLDLGYFVNSGSVSAGYDGSLTQNFTDPQALGDVPVNTSMVLSNGTLSTQSPSFGAHADVDLQLGGNFGLNASAFGHDYSVNKSFNTGVDQELFSINRNNDQSINVLGQPVNFSHTFGVQVDELPPISIDTTVSTTNNPLGASEDLSVALEQNDEENTGTGQRHSDGNEDENGGGDGASVSFHLASASQTIPVVQLNASQTNGSGYLSTGTTDDTDTQLANLQLEMGPLVAAALNMPPVFTTMEFSAGPATVDVTPLSFTLGPTMYANQQVSATPQSTITYVFDHPVLAAIGDNAPYQSVSQLTFLPGAPLHIKFDGTPIHVTPYWNFELQFHNTIKLDVSMTSTLTIGEISATLNLPQTIQDELGLPVTLGPLYQQNFNLANLPAITAYDQTFDLINKSVAMQPFTIGGNFQPTLNVTRNDDPALTSGTLRAAVNNANLLAAQNGTNEGPDTIVLGPGYYNLTNVVGANGLDDGTAGDLNVTDPNLTIIGAGAGQTMIYAGSLQDRVFDVASGGGLRLVGLTVMGGNSSNLGQGGNSFDTYGGGIRNQGTLTLDHVDVKDNQAGGGGGIANINGAATITNSTIESNSAATAGGVANLGSNVSIEMSAVNNNTASEAGAMFNEGPLNVVGSSFIGNTTTQYGGAIIHAGGQFIATDDTFMQNASVDGGAIYFLTVGDGSSTNQISGSTFSANIASGSGGAIDDLASNPLSLTNSTFVGNQAAAGGGVFDAGNMTVDSSTIVRNSVGNSAGGGIRVSPAGQLVLDNSIVAANTTADSAAPDVSGVVTSQGYNLIGNGAGSSGLTNGVNGDLVGNSSSPIDPKLGPLQDNGGTTLTVGLLEGSPAIDTGDDNRAPAGDQRGFARPSGTHVDRGAVEFVDSPLTIANFSDENVVPTISSGGALTVAQNLTLRDAVTMFNAQGGTNTIDLLAGTYALTRSVGEAAPGGTFGDLAVNNEDLTIVGAGAGQTIIDASALGDRAFDVLGGAHLHLVGVTITGGNSSNDGEGAGTIDTFGGGIRNAGTLTLKDSAVLNSVSGGEGGGIFSEFGATLSLDGSTISGNLADYGGGVMASSAVTIANSTISDNAALFNGGGYGGGLALITANSIITNSIISGNRTDGVGGGIDNLGILSITGSTISGNTAYEGGGVDNVGTFFTMTVSQSTFAGNSAQWGGGIFNEGTANIEGSTLMNNVALGSDGQDGGGGGFGQYSGGGGGGGAGLGAGIYNQNTLNLSNSTLTGNQAIGGRGGQTANANGADGPIGGQGGGAGGGAGGSDGSGAAGGFAGGGGGGAGDQSPPDNGGAGGFGGGGGGAGGRGILVNQDPTANGQGGAGGMGGGAGANTSGNHAGGGGGGAGIGGAIFNGAGQAMLLNDTIVDNGASGGRGGVAVGGGANGADGTGITGGVYIYAGTVDSQNSVFARNSASQSPDVSGGFTSLGHNFVGNLGTANGFSPTQGDQRGGVPLQATSGPTATPVIDPKLGPLQMNGGATLSEVPVAGSSLIDAGSNSGVSGTDQRGGTRIIGGTVDIGAVENQVLYVNTTQDALGQRSLRQAIIDADSLGGDQTITLAGGTYQLTLQGAGETASATGDLNVDGVNLTIVGAGAGQTIIDASQLGDRALNVSGGATLNLSGVTVEGGTANGRTSSGGTSSGGTGSGGIQVSQGIDPSRDGGDILNQGTLVISQSELKGGSATKGGALASESSDASANLTIDSSTIDGNTASATGGGLYNLGPMTITNSTISGNSAGQGGGIANDDLQIVGVSLGTPTVYVGGPVVLLNDTVSRNEATSGGGVASLTHGYTSSDKFTLKNTVVAGNRAATNNDVVGTFVSQGHNLIGDVGAASGFGAVGDQVGGGANPTIDPKLGPLQDNGGATFTMLPAADSTAVDAGDNSGAPAVDQRGIQRPLGGTVDIGAVEPVFLTVTRFDDGNLPGQLRRAIRDANSLGGSHTISLPAGTYHLTVEGAGEDGNLTGDLNILSNITLVGAGADQTIIDASALGDRAFHVEPGASLDLSGVTIEGGSTTASGGAVLNDHGTLVISQSELKDNSAALGGAVASVQSPHTTGLLQNGNFVVSTLANSTSGIDASTGTLVVADASQFPTKLPYSIVIDQEQLTVTDVAGNTLFVTRGAAGTTAAPHTFGATVSVLGSAASSTLAAIQSKITLNDVSAFPTTPGFLIQIDSELMKVVTISANSFTVVRGVDGTVTSAHQAGAKVGLINLAIDSSTFDGNTATTSGGAVYNLGGMAMTDSTVSGNTAAQSGGGIDNDAVRSGGFSLGDPVNFVGGLVTLTNDTIAGNQAAAGGGVSSADSGSGNLGAVQLHNTIVATNNDSSGSPDLSGQFASLGHNLVGNVGAATGFTQGTNGDQVGSSSAAIDPLLSPLRDNGGPLPTRALLTLSPALDTGDDAGATATDERSIPRNQGPHVDIGAYELAYDLEIDLPGGGEQSLFTDLGQGLTQMSSPNGAFQPFTFENPSHSLTIVSEAGGNDVITLGPLEQGFAVDARGDGQGDTVNLLSGAVLNPLGNEVVSGGNTLTGAGTVAAPLFIDAGGTLAPHGENPLAVDSGLVFQAGSQFAVTLGGPQAGSGYDAVVVSGAGQEIDLAGATLSAIRLASFLPAASDTFTIISNQTGQPIVGTFAGLPEGQVFDLGGVPFAITYQGGTSGHDVVLSVVRPEATGTAISSTEGASFAGAVATFTDADPEGVAGDFSALIQWGDGQTSVGTVSGSLSAGYTVTGNHTYLEEGSYPVSVAISDQLGTVTTASVASVADAALLPIAFTPPVSVEGALVNGPVFHFVDLDPAGAAGDYTAVVSLGDGNSVTLNATVSSDGQIVADPQGGFDVVLSHTYADELAAAPFSVVVSDAGGSSVSESGNVTVFDAPLVAGALTPPAAVEGVPFSATVFHFSDANPAGDLADYTAAISLGDGNSVTLTAMGGPNGQIVANPQGGFDVQLAYTYAEEIASAPFAVMVRDVGGASTSAQGTVTVADAPLLAGALTPPVAIEGQPFGPVAVFHFIDLDQQGAVNDYTATINTGDALLSSTANPGNVAIAPNAQLGGFDVLLSYTYAEELSGATFSVLVNDAGGSSVAATGKFDVADAPLIAGALTPPVATEGQAFGPVAVFHFIDLDPQGAVSDFTAIVNTGDATLTSTANPGNVAIAPDAQLGGFDVLLSYTYAEELSGATFSVSVNDPGGSSVAATGKFDVADAPLTAAALTPPVAIEGQAFGPVAVFHFTDADPQATAGDYTATVNTGDATLTSAANPTNVAIVPSTQTAGFDVLLSYTYAEELSGATFSVLVDDAGGSTAAASTGSDFSVADAPVVASGVNIKALDGLSTGPVAVATFVDQGGPESISDYGATITWGDGGSSSADIVANSDGSFSVVGAHTYAGVGSFPIAVSVTHEGRLASSTASTATVEFGGGLLVLDPSGFGTLSEIGNGNVQVAGDIRVDSSSPAAVIATGSGTLSADDLMVAGTPGVFTLGPVSLQTPVESGSASLSDPLAGVPAPVAGATPHSAVNAHGSQQMILYPGTYAGGIQVSGRAVVTLMPGTYYLAGGGLSVSGSGTIVGTGVTIYNSTPTNGRPSHDLDASGINVSGNGSLRLSAPTSGPLKNIAIFQDRSLSVPIFIGGSGNVEVTGLIYAAQAALVVSGSAEVDVSGDPSTGLLGACVCDDVAVLGTATLRIDVAGGTAGDHSPAALASLPAGTPNPAGITADQLARTLAQDSYFEQLAVAGADDDWDRWSW